MVIARAARDLAVGEELSINYGTRDLVEWPLEARRAYLLEKNGFLCQCLRCRTEEKADAE